MRSRTAFAIATLTAATAIALAGATGNAPAQGYGAGAPVNVGPRAPNISPVTPRVEPRFNRGPFQLASPPTDGDKTTTAKSSSGKSSTQSSQSGPSGQPTGTGPANARAVPNEVVIEVAGTPSEQQVEALAQRHRLTRVQSQVMPLTGSTFFRWRIPDQRSMTTVLRQLQADPNVRSVQRNYVFTADQAQPAAGAAGDPAQYTLAKLRVPQAHELARGERVLVAVIDSGIDVNHPELAGVIAGGFDTLEVDEPPHAHGTGIAGAIAAQARLRGVAPKAQILAVRAFGAYAGSAEGTTFNILRGLDWSVTRGARIVNMSFTGPNDPALRRGLAAAHRHGVLLIAAAGNAGPKSPPLYPAADPNVIAVTATDAQDRLFARSNRGGYIDVAAPGVDILLPAPGRTYQVTSGTSFAAAHVSGVAALILERQPKLRPDEVRKVLIASTKDLGPKGRDEQFGSGLTDAFAAVSSLGATAADASTAGQR
jgi:subtilisin family serine protease